MKKVLLSIVASFLLIGSAYAQPSITIGLGMNQGVFAAEGTERNFDESGALKTTTTEYGAFEDSYPSIYIEVGNEFGSLGLSLQDDVSTPQNVNKVGGLPSSNSATSKVSATFENVATIYGTINLPYNLYAKAGIVGGDIAIAETQKSGNTYKDQDLEGYVIGFGYQHELDTGMGVRFELLGHAYDDVAADNGIAAGGNMNKVTVANMIGANAQISINKTF